MLLIRRLARYRNTSHSPSLSGCMKRDPFERAVSESIGEDTVADTKRSERCFHTEMQGFYVVGWLGYYCITCNNLQNKRLGDDHDDGKSQVRHTCYSC